MLVNTHTDRPATLTAIEYLACALRAARERDLTHPLDADEQKTLGQQLHPIILGILDLDPQAREWLIRAEVESLTREIFDEEVAAGRLIDNGDGTFTRPPSAINRSALGTAEEPTHV